MNIISNNVPRDLFMPHELPDGVMQSEFDYVEHPEECGPRFFSYRGAWYDVNEFVRIAKRSNANTGFAHTVDGDSPMLAWDGIQTDTYFSGVLVRYVEDGERVIVARCYA
jgi:hypothetical protein